MELNKTLFWDTDIQKIDLEKNARSIIARTISRGTLDDWFKLKDYYGVNRIKKEIIQVRYLDKLTLNFCSKYFNIPKSEFKCYNTKQLLKQLWNY